MFRLFAIAFLSAWLAGCATSGSSNLHRLSQFTPVKTPQIIELREELIHTEKFSAWGRLDEENGLMPGKYVSTHENHLATLFYGEGRLYHRKVGTTTSLLHGGIWVPKLAHESPKIFLSMDRADTPIHEALPDGASPVVALTVVFAEAVSGPSHNEGAMTHPLNEALAEKLKILLREQLESSTD